MRRFTTAILLAFLSATLAFARHSPILMEPAETIDMQQALFSSGGILEMKDSMGDVEVTGWEQPQIEVTVTKSTSRRYAPEEMEKGLAQLERIVVTTDQVTDNHIVIRTECPPSNLFARALSSRPDIHLSYRIKVPRQTRLIIRHDVGEVRVHDMAANMEVSTRVGDIDVKLPDDQRYTVDAKARVGDVDSDWCPAAQRYSMDGDMMDGTLAHHVTLRVGVGDIVVRKTHYDCSLESFEG